MECASDGKLWREPGINTPHHLGQLYLDSRDPLKTLNFQFIPRSLPININATTLDYAPINLPINHDYQSPSLD